MPSTNAREFMQTSSLFPDNDVPTVCPSPRSELLALTKLTLLDKAWSIDGWKMIRGATRH